MIVQGDRIAVGVSGGKDSMALVTALAKLMQFYPIPFDLQAIHVDLGLPGHNAQAIEAYCNELGVPYIRIETQISEVILNTSGSKSPCAMCAYLRKGALYQMARELGIGVIAYAHHKDDFVATTMMQLMYEGQFASLEPSFILDAPTDSSEPMVEKQQMQGDIRVIRPLLYLSEAEIRGYVNKYQIPVVKSKCPADGCTKRTYAENLLNEINKDVPGVKDKIFTAIKKKIF